eukprot:3820322-Pyramimonas_sp.AAC.1
MVTRPPRVTATSQQLRQHGYGYLTSTVSTKMKLIIPKKALHNPKTSRSVQKCTCSMIYPSCLRAIEMWTARFSVRRFVMLRLLCLFFLICPLAIMRTRLSCVPSRVISLLGALIHCFKTSYALSGVRCMRHNASKQLAEHLQ